MVTTTGYPDYQRLSAQSGDILGVWQPTINGDETLQIIDCHGYGYLDFSVNDFGGSAYFTVTLSFDVNPDGGNEVASFEFMPTPNGEQTLQFPVIARYCTVIVNWVSGVKTDAPFLAAFGSNAIAPNRMTSQPSMPLIYYNNLIAASSSASIGATTTVQGAATLSITCSGGSPWTITVAYYSAQSATWNNYMLLEGSVLGGNAVMTIGIPPAPLLITMTNTDTASHSFHVSITMQ